MASNVKKHRGLRYQRVAISLRERIRAGFYDSSRPLPKQHDLAKEYGVSFVTLRSALDILDKEGYLDRRVGQGTFAKTPDESRPRALVIDDDAGVRRYLARALSLCDWDSRVAGSGEEGLELFREDQYDLIFLDLKMIGMRGAEVILEIRKMDGHAPVVIITAYPESDLMWEALKAGPLAVMCKPFTMEDLQALLHTIKLV